MATVQPNCSKFWSLNNAHCRYSLSRSLLIACSTYFEILAASISLISRVADNIRNLCVSSFKGIGSVCKQHPVTKFEKGVHGASKQKFNHMTIY